MTQMPVIAAAVLAFFITAVMGIWLVPLMRRLKYGQTIKEDGPRWQMHKQGTPTMGGIQFAVGIAVGTITGFLMLKSGSGGSLYSHTLLDDTRIVLGLVMALAFGFIGFVDDYIKVIKKRNLGLNERQKLIMQFIVAILYLAGLYLAGDRSTTLFIPFLPQWDIGLLYYPLAVLGIVYFVNVVNFTDGIDGLCASVTFIVALGLMACATILRVEGMSVLSAALAGGCVGFLIWNFHPARIFMGDTGSMLLGGVVVAIAFGLKIPIYLLFLGMIYILEGISVILQMLYFKLTRRLTGTPKRLFKMSPIHHHFEMSGWSEAKIVLVFSFAQFLLCLVAVYALMQI